MLGYISDDTRGASDRLLCQMAERLQDKGLKLAGAVQENVGGDESTPCDMVLRVLGLEEPVTISQRLGPHASGCRLDAGALERAVGLVEATLNDATDLLIINKFGKQEIEGRGFRSLVADALSHGIPVLTAIRPSQLEAFTDFAGEMAEEVKANPQGIYDWLTTHREMAASP